MSLFEELVDDIRVEYDNNPNDLGWRFLHTSKQTLKENNGILLITANPGGNKFRTDQPMESCEGGCAYLSESWKDKQPGESKLQKQFQGLFQEIAKRLDIPDYKVVLESAVCGHFIPFRSPSLALLKDKERCIEFSKGLWKKVLSNLQFQLIVCIDKNTYHYISGVLLSLSYHKVQEKSFPIEWGNCRSLVSKFERGNEKLRLVWFPHLSTFSIFGREKSKEAVNKIMNEAMLDYGVLSD